MAEAAKGVFFFLSLLCLIQATSSLVDRDHLDVLQEYFQKGKVHAALKKANLEDEIIKVLKHYKEEMEKLYPILRLLKTATSESALHRGLMKVIDDFLDQQNQNLAAYREQRESELEEIWNFVEVVDVLRDEL